LVVSSRNEEISAERQSDLLISFVNTLDVEEATDALATPQTACSWLRDSGAVAGDPRLDADSHRQLVELREALRALLRANNGGDAAADELKPLRRTASEAGSLQANVGAGGAVRIEPAGEGAAAFAATLLLAVARLQELGAWERLKICPADDCQWAFLDNSRNRSRHWCSMEVCGNRSKTRRYRSRKTG
jgi:predicted RNA-binding Zn ribbon-like protein